MKKLMIAFLLLGSISALAQDAKQSYKVAVKTGMYFRGNETSGFIYGMNMTFRKSKLQVLLDYDYSDERQLFGPSPSEIMNSISLNLGLNHNIKLVNFNYGLGSSYSFGIMRGDSIDHDKVFFPTVIHERVDLREFGINALAGIEIRIFERLKAGIDLVGILGKRWKSLIVRHSVSYEF